MGSTSIVLQFACLLFPNSMAETSSQEYGTAPRPPAVLHVVSAMPDLLPVAIARPLQDDDGALIQKTEGTETPGHAMVVDAIATSITVQDQSTPTNGMSLNSPVSGRRDSKAAGSSAQSVRTGDRETRSKSEDEVAVPQSLRVHSQQKPAPPPAPMTRRPIETVLPPADAPQDEVPHVATRVRAETEPSTAAPPRRLFDPGPVGSGVRPMPTRSPTHQGTTDRTVRTRSGVPVPNTSAASNKSSLQIMLAGANRFAVGQEQDFQVVIANHGVKSANSLTVWLAPSSAMRVTVLDRAADIDARTGAVRWQVDNIAAGEQVVIRFKAVANRGGTLVHDLRVVDQQGQPAVARVSTVVVGNNRGR